MLLREKDKAEIISLAKKTFTTALNIWAYGSRVTGEAHDTSDLDLVILTKNEQPIDIEQFIRFKERLVNSNIPLLIQVMDWNRMPISFRDNILSNYVELME